jgi:hypothetical protein
MNAFHKTRLFVLYGAMTVVAVGLAASPAQAQHHGHGFGHHDYGHNYGHFGHDYGHYDHNYGHYDHDYGHYDNYGHYDHDYGHYDHDIELAHCEPVVRYVSKPYTYQVWKRDCHGERYAVRKTGYRSVPVTDIP